MSNQVYDTFTELPKLFTTMIGKVVEDGKEYKNITEWYKSLQEKDGEHILLLNIRNTDSVKVVVKEQALSDTPFFKFNAIYNAGNPIPKTEMFGLKLEENDRMVKMDLWDKDHKVHWVGWLLKSWLVEGR